MFFFGLDLCAGIDWSFQQKFLDVNFIGGAKCNTDGSSVRLTWDSVDIHIWGLGGRRSLFNSIDFYIVGQ